MTGKYKAPAVKKAFQILKLISDNEKGLSISELAKILVISKGTVHGITSILEDIGAIIRDPSSKRYELGLTMFELGRRAFSQIDLREMARPVMEELMEKVQETVFLGLINGDHTTILDIVECRHDFKITSPIGTTIPLFAAATGKIFLSRMNEKEAIKIILSKGLPGHTDKSITDPEQFLQEIRAAKENGYATDYEEYLSGVRAIAAPIRGRDNRLAAIWVVGFRTSLTDDKMNLLKKEIIDSALKISLKIKGQQS